MREVAPFQVMAKPIGPKCNLACRYCYYLEKEALYPGLHPWRMSDEVLESYIRQYIEAQPGAEVSFTWQGGEPTLLGVDYFRRVVEMERRYANGKRVTNALQTNGSLLDDDWCGFMREEGFLVGLSLDGPRELHDTYRVDRKDAPTFDAVMRALELLKRHGVEFNTLTVVSRANARHPVEVYRFLREAGSGYLQFIPLVERATPGAQPADDLTGAHLAPPPEQGAPGAPVTDWSVRPAEWGEFLCGVFDEWVRRDVGRIYVQMFDAALGAWAGEPASLCLFAPTCGAGLALEHNGDVYSCDHYVYPAYRLGNLREIPLAEMASSPRQQAFGEAKRDTLPADCRRCPFLFACWGECPKRRFARASNGLPGLNYLCTGYKRFYAHADPALRVMAHLLKAGRAPAEVMDLLAARRAPSRAPGRNDPCPCGSGRKYKQCCSK